MLLPLPQWFLRIPASQEELLLLLGGEDDATGLGVDGDLVAPEGVFALVFVVVHSQPEGVLQERHVFVDRGIAQPIGTHLGFPLGQTGLGDGGKEAVPKLLFELGAGIFVGFLVAQSIADLHGAEPNHEVDETCVGEVGGCVTMLGTELPQGSLSLPLVSGMDVGPDLTSGSTTIGEGGSPIDQIESVGP